MHKVVEILKQLIANIVIANAIVFNRIYLPLWDKSLSFQVCNCYHSFIFISENACFLDLPIMGERPSYSSYCVAPLQPHMTMISSFTFSLTFLLKIMVVLLMLMYWLKARAYCFIKDSRWLYETWFALQRIKLSSTNKRLLIIRAPRHTRTPFDKCWFFKQANQPFSI